MSDTEKYHTDSEVFSHDTALVLFKIQPQIFHSSSLRLQLSPPVLSRQLLWLHCLVSTQTHTHDFTLQQYNSLTLFNKLG